MTDPRRPTNHLPTLDGWRGVAVLMVIVYHSIGTRVPAAKPLGSLGVSLFFALSGLLICNRLLVEFDRARRIDLGGFYVRRVFRILPPAFAYLAALAMLGASTPRDLGSCVFFWRNYLVDGGWYTGHFWSLAVEEHFYLFFPVVLALAGPRRALWLAGGLTLVLLCGRQVDVRWAWVTEWTGVSPYFRTDTRLPDLLCGALTAIVCHGRIAPVGETSLAHGGNVFVRLAAVGGGFVLIARMAGKDVPWAAQSVLLPCLLLGAVVRPDGWLGRALEWRPLAWVGRMSYSLYLWQQLFCHDPKRYRLAILGPLQDWPWNVVGLFAAAAASHYLVERPLTRLGRTLAGRQRTNAEPHVEAYRVVVGRRRGVVAPLVPERRR